MCSFLLLLFGNCILDSKPFSGEIKVVRLLFLQAFSVLFVHGLKSELRRILGAKLPASWRIVKRPKTIKKHHYR